MSVSRDEVERLAALARLRLSEEEIDRLAAELSEVLGHLESLPEGAEREGGTVGPAHAPLRDDSGAPDAMDRPVSALAPAWVDGFFTVPRLAALDAGARDPEAS